MRHHYETKKLLRHKRKPAELILVPMIDIFTVLVTFLLMTAVFSHTVVLELNLPPPQTITMRCEVGKRMRRKRSAASPARFMSV